MLTPRDAVLCLIEEGLVPPRAVLDQDVRVIRSSRRHRHLRVVSVCGQGFFLKQGIQRQGFGSVSQEATVLRALHNSAECEDLAGYLPRFYRYESTAGVLMTELLQDAEDLRTSFRRLGRISLVHSDRMGRAMAALHSVPRDVLDRARLPGGAVHPPPWALNLPQPRLPALAEMSRASRDLIRIIQKYSEFARAFERLREDWRTDALIHYDLKWDNVMITKRSLKLIDWELAGVGDPRWDVGGVLHEFLVSWLTSLPVTRDAPRMISLRREQHPIANMRGAITRFWKSYSGRMQLQGVEASEFLEQSVRFAAVRLVQTSFELTQNANELQGVVLYFLQCSLNILADANRAAVDLFGLNAAGIRREPI
jgi:aminoglycoside phosphotransferase (APT) family kinase protein